MLQSIEYETRDRLKKLLGDCWDQVRKVEYLANGGTAKPNIVGQQQTLLSEVKHCVTVLKDLLQEADTMLDKMLPKKPAQ